MDFLESCSPVKGGLEQASEVMQLLWLRIASEWRANSPILGQRITAQSP